MSSRGRARRLLAVSVLVLWGCGGPLAVFPGGALDGHVKSTPQNFAFARDAGTIQLETRPDDPYSVNIACVVVGGALYVSAGDKRRPYFVRARRPSHRFFRAR